MCDWREPCDWPDAFLIDRRPEPPLTSCFRHLGVLTFTPGVNWPLNLAWCGGPELPKGLVQARMRNSCLMLPFLETTPNMIFGTVAEDPWSDTEGAEPVDKTMEHGNAPNACDNQGSY
jgi:hypothetical protein